LRSRRNLLVAATAVVVLLAGGLYYALGGTKSDHGATPPVTTGPTGKPAVHMLAAGQTGDRAAIPWTLIGPGWTLANVSTGPATSSGTPAGGSHITYLVDPAGGKYRIRTTYGAAPYLLAWSGDAKEALYAVSGAAGSPAASYGLLTLDSGNMTPLHLPAGVTALGFTRPDGLNILAIQQTNLKYRLQRYNFEGTVQATIGAMPRAAGAPNVPQLNVLSSPDGKTAVWGVDGNGMQVVDNAGGFSRKLRMPGVGSPKSCTPISWWTATSILAYCSAAGQPDTGRLWLAPVAGGQPQPLTGISGSLSGQGYLTGAWQTAGAVYITAKTPAQCSGAPSGPGGQQILQLSSSGAEASVKIPASTNNHDSVVAAVRGQLLVLAQTSCPGTSSLIWFNPSTHATRNVLTAPATQAGVISAVPYGSGPAAYSG
jgi:TolB protein